MAEKWHVGNANTDGERTRGWLLGHFIGEGDDPRASRAVEVKWGVHPAGEGREGWATFFFFFFFSLSLFFFFFFTPSGVQGLTIPGRPRRTPS